MQWISFWECTNTILEISTTHCCSIMSILSKIFMIWSSCIWHLVFNKALRHCANPKSSRSVFFEIQCLSMLWLDMNESVQEDMIDINLIALCLAIFGGMLESYFKLNCPCNNFWVEEWEIKYLATLNKLLGKICLVYLYSSQNSRSHGLKAINVRH